MACMGWARWWPGYWALCLLFTGLDAYAQEAEQMPGADPERPRLTLNLRQASVRDALQLLADELELNVVLSDEVTGEVSLHVEQLDLAQTLEALLFGSALSFRLFPDPQQPELLVVGLPEQLTALDLSRQQRRQSVAEVYTEYMRLKYADANALFQMLSEAESGAGLLSQQGSSQVDERTNTLVVRDTADNLQAIRALIQVLDVPVNQVLIEARIVNATLDTGRELGVRWGLGPATETDNSALDLLFGADHRSASSAAVRVLRDRRLLDVEISALERAGEAELIARPRVTTQDNMPALIQSGVRIPYQAQAGGTAGGSITEFVDAVLSLEVTPMVTPDGRIIMRLNIRQDSVASGSGEVPAINTNTIATSVLVHNGDTLVLGGIFREEQTRADTGTPGLRRIPGLGRLFQREVSVSHRTELLIFITPQII